MRTMTVVRGVDGFGSQMFAIISGLAFARKNGIKFLHTQLSGIRLIDRPSLRNDELDKANSLIDSIIHELGIQKIAGESGVQTYTYLYDEILKDVNSYYDLDFLQYLQSAYKKEKPSYFKEEEHNIAIHIRRGKDLFQNDYQYRYIQNQVYENMISILQEKYRSSKIHIFSWGDPELQINTNNVEYHITQTPENFVEDFNAMVHADILIAGSSTFSLSAGFFNKNIVVSDQSLCHLVSTPIPPSWINNYQIIFG